MKIEDLIKDLSAQYIGEIERGESLFNFVPNNIGELKFCYSSNYKACADSWKVRRKQYITSIAILISIAILSWIIFSNSPIWNTICTIVCIGILIYSLKKISTFKGTDYFVGTKGFCLLNFNTSRDNILNKQIIFFNEVSDLITEQVHIRRNGAYQETQYYVCFVSDKDEVIKFWKRGRYNKDDKDAERIFYDNIIECWKNYKINKDLGKIPLSFNAFIIKDGNIKNALYDYIHVEDTLIRIHGQEYKYDDIKKIKFEAYGGTGLLIEHKNHEIIKKSFWRKNEVGDVEHIPLSALGNQDFVIAYFIWLIKSKGLPHDD